MFFVFDNECNFKLFRNFLKKLKFQKQVKLKILGPLTNEPKGPFFQSDTEYNYIVLNEHEHEVHKYGEFKRFDEYFEFTYPLPIVTEKHLFNEIKNICDTNRAIYLEEISTTSRNEYE